VSLHRSPALRAQRLLLACALSIGAALTITGTAFAVAPEGDGAGVALDPPDVSVSTEPAGPASSRQGGPKVSRGYDVSYPQCGGQLPANPLFAIVGVNGGRVFGANPCLSTELVWGGGANAELYANTGNPGPALSMYWPSGQTTPLVCDAANPDTVECAYDYGWNAANYSFQTAQSAYAALGITANPSATGWWLDVETSNSWRSGSPDDLARNVAALQGEVDALRAGGVTRLGFYSTQLQWDQITGGSRQFAAYPSWLAGGGTLKGAQQLCTRPAFTGGATVLAQYFASGFDADLRC
jgi:hypothetical protein